jgi:putative endonuclease
VPSAQARGVAQTPGERGAAAERLAADYLTARGIEVLARNVRFRCGELDLVCREENILVIVEVRHRQKLDFGGALGSVTWRKQRKIMRATRLLLARHAAWRGSIVRFDVLAVQADSAGTIEISWVKNAFWSST